MNLQEFNALVEAQGVAKAYGIATGRTDWAEKLNELIPDYMQSGLVWWIIAGVVPGGFLQTVIEGKLYEAVAHADDTNVSRLHIYVSFFFNYAPIDCFRPGALKNWKGILE